MSLQQNFLNVVNKAQNEGFCHKKLMKSIENSLDINDLEDFLNVYSKALLKLYCSEYADKNHFVARGLEFLAKLAIKITLKYLKPMDVTNPDGTSSQVYDITTDQFFTSLLKRCLKYASVEKPEVRFNTCYFIMVLLQNIGNNVEMDYTLCNSILESLVELLDDTKVNVRLQALRALVRLQEPGNPECVVLNSFLALFSDANSEVRKAVVSLVAPHPQSFSKIRERLTDTDIGVRQTAYTKWADTNPKLYLKIVDRNFILTCGFADMNKKIKQILTEKLLPKWLNAYAGNYLDLLKALKLDADENDMKNFEDLCTKVMEVYLKIHPLSDILKYLPTNKENKLIPIKQLRIESVLYWSILVSFLRKKDEGEDYLEGVLPELTQFSNYIERVIKEKSATSMDEWENLEYQNIILQLFKMASGFDMSDEVGRKTFYSIILQILSTYKFQQKVIDVIISVAFKLNNNIDVFTTDLCQVISEIREPLIDEIPSEGKLRARNFEISQLKVQIHRLEIAEEDALKLKDFQHANIVHNELIECQRQLENLMNVYSQSEKVRTSKDDPETICRCLDILIGLLKLPNINKMSSALLTCREEFLMPLLNNNISDIHWRFILCLGLFSVLDRDTAFKHANFICLPIATYRAVPNYDKNALKISVACVTDLIRAYGVKVIGIEDTNSLINQDNQSTSRRKLYSEDMNELRTINKDDITIEFIIDIILDMLDDEDEDVRNSAATAISRLMVFNFPVNPELIARLILKWYNPLTVRKDTKLQQQVGFIITCFTDTVKGSRRIVEKAVIPIISSLANAPRTSSLVDIDIDNVLKFLSALTNVSNANETENIHNSLAVSIIEKISNKPNDVCTPHLAKMLTYLNLGFDDSVSLKNMISSVELMLTDILDKAPRKNIIKFMSKLKTSMTAIQEEPESTVSESQLVSESTLNEQTNPSEGNIKKTTADQNTSVLKSPTKSPSMSKLTNDKQKVQEVHKRTLYVDIERITCGADESNEEKNRKGNVSESEEDIVKVTDKSSVGKNRENSRDSYRACKQLSLMKLRRKSRNLPRNTLKGRQTLSKIPEGSEESSNKSITREKNNGSRELNESMNGDSKSSSKQISDDINIESSTDVSRLVFVKCDYTPLKNGLKNGQNSNTVESSKSALNADNSPNNANKQLGDVEIAISKKDNSRKSLRLKKINVISQVVLRTSETSINENKSSTSHKFRSKSEKKQVRTSPIQNSHNKTKSLRNMATLASSKTSVEKNSETANRFQNIPSKDEKTPQRTLRQRSDKPKSSEKKCSKDVTTSSVPPNSVRSSRVISSPRKLNDYHTPLSNEKIRGSSRHTPFKKRVAKTPLSASGGRLLKKVSSTNKISSQNTGVVARLSVEPSSNTHSERKSFRDSVRKKTYSSSISTPDRKRRCGTPNSILKEKPSKIAKVTNCADQNQKPIKNITNATLETKEDNSEKRSINKNEQNENTKTMKSRPKDKVQSRRSLRIENKSSDTKIKHNTRKLSKTKLGNPLKTQQITEKSSRLVNSKKEKSNNLIKENHTNSNETINGGNKGLRPVLIEVDINESKNNTNKSPKMINRRSGRIKGENEKETPKRREEESRSENLSSDIDNFEKQSQINDCLNKVTCEPRKVNSSIKGSRVLMDSGQNSFIEASKSSKSVMNETKSDLHVTSGRCSKRFQKSKNKGVDIENQSSRGRNGLKLNGNLSIEGSSQSVAITSTVTRSRMNSELNCTRNNSSKRHLDFSSLSEETLLKTFLQGDEEFQMLEDMSIEDVTSSNSSGDSKKENVSINTSSTSSSGREVRTRRRIRTKHSLSPDSGLSPKRKILRTNQKRILRSAV